MSSTARKSVLMGVLATALVLTALPSVYGQGNRPTVRAKGKLQAAAGSTLQLVDGDGKQWLVKIDPRSRALKFQGSAAIPFLRRGMLVEFRSAFDKRGRALRPIDRLKVFSPTPDTKIGLTPDVSSLGKGLFKDTDGDETKRPPPVLAYRVAGTLRGIKDGSIQVAAGRTVVQAGLAEDLQITVDVADIRLARPGDTVEASGWAMPGMDQVILANRLTITGARPLGVEEKRTEEPGKGPDLNSLDNF